MADKSKLCESLATSILYSCETGTLFAGSEKGIQAFQTKCTRKLLLGGTQDRRLCAERDQLPFGRTGTSYGNGISHGPGISHATTASPVPSFRTPWRVGDAVVARGNAGWTTSKSGHPCPCQNCSQRPPAEKAWKRISVEASAMCPR